ncbi:hypothetical protein P3342_002083 [Pyrenophora teres f. teres]|nr:hypothetical protein HRS9139_03032 [Pyrenophora teres f. teres]KAE8844615.1 hypothetical protein PTNB85_02880 [Pyrenophora teres f. teres]KAK1919790.1 hypothetical protein P3342_002083 [Pyrenophora teres f. teres]
MMLILLNLLAAMEAVELIVSIFLFAWRQSELITGGIVTVVRSLVTLKNQSMGAEDPNPTIIYDPVFTAHLIVYRTLEAKMFQVPSWKRNAELSGRRFALNADSIIAGNLPVDLQELGVSTSPALKRRLGYILSLPQLRVTPPDDGDRSPEPGEKGGKKPKVARRLLRPPKKVGKAGKEKRIEEEKARRSQAEKK